MGPLFTTLDGDALWEAFLGALPAGQRQHYTCRACRTFVTRYGGLVSINPDGTTDPLCWVPEVAGGIMRPVVSSLHAAVRVAKVSGVFVTSERILGQPVTGAWHHMAGTLPDASLYTGKALSADQRAAELRQDFETLCRGLAEFKRETIVAAVSLLEGDDLYRGEKTLGVARWLLDLYDRRGQVRGPAKNNLTWLAVAQAPAGWCHVRSTMIGTLLGDIEAGEDFGTVSRSFKARMSPLLYQRPQALPHAGTVLAAEALVAKLDVASALARRFARPDEVVALWRPPVHEVVPPSGGVFAGVKTRDQKPVGPPAALQGIAPKVITWERFEADVLPKAESIYAKLHHACMPFYALTTATDPDAPPILQWDRAEQRNPVAWYTTSGGSTPSWWSLPADWHPVEAVCAFPPRWHDRSAHTHQTPGALLLLKGAVPTRAGTGLFPEFLRSEYHGIRSVSEQHQRDSCCVEPGVPAAVGLGIRTSNMHTTIVVRVLTDGVEREYVIDRWR